MTLAEIKPMHGESLYDRDGNLVGKWNGERGMFADCYVVRERTCEYDYIEDEGGRCSRCHVYLDGSERYCPDCGCRVTN